MSYALAALIAGNIHVQRNDPVSNSDGESTLYLVSNGVHINIALPTVSPAMDWRTVLPDAHLADYPYVYFGWGSRTFYQSVPTWADLSAAKAWQALAWDDSVIAVTPGFAPLPNQPLSRKLVVKTAQLRRLSANIRAQFAAFTALPTTDYPLLYPAHAHYHPFLTCNEWVRRRLYGIGLRVPLWSPFDRPLLRD